VGLERRVVAWVALVMICSAVFLGAYLAISSSLSFFESEASRLGEKLDNAPQLLYVDRVARVR
jgi:hypothetical protein